MKLIEELDTSTKKDIIIDGLMRSKGVYLLVSKPKVGKSMLALQLSYCITNGLPFLGHKVTLSPVLYISTESDFGQLQDRYKTLDLVPKEDSLFVIDRDGKPNISIFDHEWEIADFAGDKTTNKLVIIDMLKDMDLGISYDINDFQDLKMMNNHLLKIRTRQVLLRSNESDDSDYFGIFKGEILKLTIGLCPSEIGHK